MRDNFDSLCVFEENIGTFARGSFFRSWGMWRCVVYVYLCYVLVEFVSDG